MLHEGNHSLDVLAHVGRAADFTSRTDNKIALAAEGLLRPRSAQHP